MPRTSKLSLPRCARSSAAVAAAAALALSLTTASGAVAVTEAATSLAAPTPDRLLAPSADSRAHTGAKTSNDQLDLRIRRSAPRSGYSTFANFGAAALKISVVEDDGGTLVDGNPRVHASRDRAVRYPRHTSALNAPHAVIQAVDLRGPDDLAPRGRPFRFGADFILDKVSEDAGPGGRDNGDNLLQRGRFNERSQYKVQVDHRVATCRVKGSLGAVSVSSSLRPLKPGHWYRVRCVRVADRLTIVLTTWGHAGVRTVRDARAGSIGAVSPGRRTAPVSIGGKLARRGVIDTESDQFNGRIDNILLRIRR
jgi:hypothetical protein